jgi:hypothetical protein
MGVDVPTPAMVSGQVKNGLDTIGYLITKSWIEEIAFENFAI